MSAMYFASLPMITASVSPDAMLIRSAAVVNVTVVFEDIDGDANGGEFEKAEATPEVKRTKKGDKSWYGGAFETRADVVLKKK